MSDTPDPCSCCRPPWEASLEPKPEKDTEDDWVAWMGGTMTIICIIFIGGAVFMVAYTGQEGPCLPSIDRVDNLWCAEHKTRAEDSPLGAWELSAYLAATPAECDNIQTRCGIPDVSSTDCDIDGPEACEANANSKTYVLRDDVLSSGIGIEYQLESPVFLGSVAIFAGLMVCFVNGMVASFKVRRYGLVQWDMAVGRYTRNAVPCTPRWCGKCGCILWTDSKTLEDALKLEDAAGQQIM